MVEKIIEDLMVQVGIALTYIIRCRTLAPFQLREFMESHPLNSGAKVRQNMNPA